MTEYRFVTFRQPHSQLVPPIIGGVSVLTVDFLKSIPELREHMDGWEVVNFQPTLLEDSVLLMILLRTSVSVEDHGRDFRGDDHTDG